MKLKLLDKTKNEIGDFEVSDDVFVSEPNTGLVHQLLLLQHTRPFRNAQAKVKSEVRGGGAKPWKQKGTGRARAGSIRSPLWKGGGVIFGPRFHKISIDMPKRARQLALCSALSLKKEDIILLDKLPSFDIPKTKQALEFIKLFELADKKILFIIDKETDNIEFFKKSFSNVQKCHIIYWQNLNVHDLFNADCIITDSDILKNIEKWLLTRKQSKTKREKVA